MNRTIFLIDGFNLYHSVRDASRDLGRVTTKWLDLSSFCRSYLSLIGDNAQLIGIYYFSALASHLNAVNPGVTKRHNAYIRCLENTGVGVELARFKKKQISFSIENSSGQVTGKLFRHEEKETDVAIAVKLMEILYLDQCDTIVLVSGDTDIAPALKTSRLLFPSKEIWVAMPYKRKNKELENIVKPNSFKISAKAYLTYQFPDPVVLSDGQIIKKPKCW